MVLFFFFLHLRFARYLPWYPRPFDPQRKRTPARIHSRFASESRKKTNAPG